MSSEIRDRFNNVMKSFVKKKKLQDVSPPTEDSNGAEEVKGRDDYFRRVKGSDPAAATCRGKLQYRRSRLNVDINKHLMLRQGAENLLRAAENKKVRQAVALELSFVNSNLQYLKEELSDLNSSVEIYQKESKTQHIPMIPFGLKETKPIDFADAFKDFIQEHYSEDADHHLPSLQELTDVRQAMRTPQRNKTGLALLFEYYNQLYFIERRFFPPDRSLGVHFEWYDSLTGLPSCQRTVAFEKASVLFNIAALHSQLGAREERDSIEGLDNTIDNYARAAGIYRYILENFSNAPSRDLDPDVLEILSQLMLAQVAECQLEKLQLGQHRADLAARLEMGTEAAQVSDVYSRLREKMAAASLAPEESVPASWQQMAHIKQFHYAALAHRHFALGLLEHEGPLSRQNAEKLQHSQRNRDDILGIDLAAPRNLVQAHYLGKCHLNEAVTLHEECLRLYRMSRELKKREMLYHVLRTALELASERFIVVQKEDDFDEPVEPPAISGSTRQSVALRPPDFSQYPVADLLRALGPVQVFSAHHHWSAPRTVTVARRAGEGLGFSVKMEAPVVVVDVEATGAAERAGLKEGDYIVGMNGRDLKWSTHTDVVHLIRKASSDFHLVVVTPMDKSEPPKEPPRPASSHAPLSDKTWGSLSSSGVSSGGASSRKPSPSSSLASQNSKTSARRHSWNPFKRNTAKSEHAELYADCGVLR